MTLIQTSIRNPPRPRSLAAPTGPRTITSLPILLTFVGLASVAVGSLVAPHRTAANILLVSFALIGIGLGAVFFLAVQYLCGATWAHTIRHVPAVLCGALVPGSVGLLAVVLLRPSLYPWYLPAAELAEHLVGFKATWLDRPFFLARTIVYLSGWLLLARAINNTIRREDAAAARCDWPGAATALRRNIRLSALFMVVFAATFWLASFDWIMSLEPTWFSTIFGIYQFAGGFTSALALIIALAVRRSTRGTLRAVPSADQLHDLGKLLFAFCTFWMYIWFSQYMLIWYSNVPEETHFYVRRLEGVLTPLTILNLFLNWIVPFFALLSARAKRNPSILFKVALVVLAGRWLDLYLTVLPAVGFSATLPGPWELGILLGGAGVLLLLTSRKRSIAGVLQS